MASCERVPHPRSEDLSPSQPNVEDMKSATCFIGILAISVSTAATAVEEQWTWVSKDTTGKQLEIALAGPDGPTAIKRPIENGGARIRAKIRIIDTSTGSQRSQNKVAMDFANCDPRLSNASFIMSNLDGSRSKTVAFKPGAANFDARLGNALCSIGTKIINGN